MNIMTKAAVAAGLLYATTVGASAHVVPGGYGYYAFGPYRHYAAERFYQCEHFNCASGCCPIGSSMYPGGYCGWHVVGWRGW
jgi:hypothetical protein